MTDTDSASVEADDTDRSAQTGVVVTAVVIAVAALVVDQVTKNLAVSSLHAGPVDLPGPFTLSLVANRGIFLGLSAPTWFVVLATAVVLVVAARGIARGRGLHPLAYGLIAGGALGNTLDRLVERPHFPAGAVVDWIRFRSGPIFNLADAFLVAGVVLLAVVADGRSPAPARGD